MNFMQLLKSLDELLYEVMSWLVFFPITLWRILTGPLAMMEYSHRELHDREAQQFDDALSPPLFLLLALLLAHGIELAAGEQANPIVVSQAGMATLVKDDTSLLVLRLLLFSVIPLMLAASNVIARKERITRLRLKAPFYTQCYPGAVYALAISTAAQIDHLPLPDATLLTGLALLAITFGYFVLEVIWFRRHMALGFWQALTYVFGGFATGLAVTFGIVFLFA